SVAGPSVLKHMVDTVLWFEGDKTLSLRMIRATKNRFGPTDEVGIFTMLEGGLMPIRSPEKMFLSNSDLVVPGSAISAILQGTRSVLVEIQALVTPTKLPIPRRVAQGLDAKRLEILLAVLSKRCGINLYEHDCFVNVSGGINVGRDPSVDLAVCAAIASSYFDKPLPSKTLIIGEVDLLGAIRNVSGFDKRKKEAENFGYHILIEPNEGKYVRDLIDAFLRNKTN
ncbi:MAG: DNA repair protein RadA, partial [Patescibacteria group bacterium]|nr:DNA repair protein RadA [Patescibacteria group bacterium]